MSAGSSTLPAPLRAGLLLAALVVPGQAASGPGADAAGPAFDCSRARAGVEQAICRTPRLARLDGALGRAWTQLGALLSPEQRSCLRADQRAWLASRDACQSSDCVAHAYRDRLAALHGLLPGLAGDADMDFGPDADTAGAGAPLLAILPAGNARAIVEDELQDVILEGRPLEDEGGYLLVDGVFDREAWRAFLDLQGDIEALRARFGDGPVHLPGIVGGFDAGALDDRARAAIEAAATGGGRLRVIGRAAYTDAAPPLVASGHCAFVYALSPP